jgi:hypothetical protein
MGLRCSLLGHSYGEPEIERERDDRGDEVVVTVREVRECERCGTESVVSENTEVRPVEPAPTTGDDGESADAGGPDAGSPDAGGPDAGSPDAGSPDAGSPDAGGSFATGGDVGSSVDDEFEPPESAAEDDAVILDDDGEEPEPERDPGEWPEAEDTRMEEAADEDPLEPDAVEDAGDAPEDDGEDAEILDADAAASDADADDDTGADADTGGWPDPGPDAADEGFDAEPADDDGEVEMGGLTPRGVSGGEESDGEGVVGTESSSESADASGDDAYTTGIERGGSSAGERSDDVDVDAEFVCPSCDYRESILDSSLREGDICPECRRGYLSEQSATRN